jgi:hypothetical protein
LLVGLGVGLGAFLVNRARDAPFVALKYAPNKEPLAEPPPVEPITPEPVGATGLGSLEGAAAETAAPEIPAPAERALTEGGSPRGTSAPVAEPVGDEGPNPRSPGRTGRLTWDDF